MKSERETERKLVVCAPLTCFSKRTSLNALFFKLNGAFLFVFYLRCVLYNYTEDDWVDCLILSMLK
ncbi:hypothetical protein BpHYR1_007061 [Brachionus plicatilis]|uniref:Uncharacterized protein n=1 Tax=Brachionus plicatilis TaxID=10195 RepID=A0A3M7PCV1_BRAPC|nr:hypothetical protein BpHYR1_007061 [Brachionus plicatilis]